MRDLPSADQLSQFDVVTAIGLLAFATLGLAAVIAVPAIKKNR